MTKRDSTDPLVLDGETLSVDDVLRFLSDPALPVEISPQAARRVDRVKLGVDQALERGGKSTYGFHTGLGRLKSFAVGEAEQSLYQSNILYSHAAGIGPYFDEDVSRLSMLLRANLLLRGNSGVRLELVERLVLFLQKGLLPMLRQIGSLGVGDLQPMAQLGLCLVGKPEGELQYQGKVGPADEVLRLAQVEPIDFPLARLEALALISGGTVQLATSLYALAKARRLLDLSDAALSLSLEAMRGSMDAYDARVHEARGVQGQIQTAANARRLLRGSQFTTLEGQKVFGQSERVQDPVSYRASPQVHGAVRDALSYVESVLSRALNAASDNPLFFELADGSFESLSGGNFHGAGTGYSMDLAAIVLTDLAVLSERRSARLLDPNMSYGLPMNLVAARHGLNTGFALIQANAVALVSEMRILCTPASAGSIPSKNNQEDHNGLGMTAARKCLRILDSLEITLAIEILCACQAIDLIWQEAPELKLGAGTSLIHQLVRSKVPVMLEDSYTGMMLFTAMELMRSEELLETVRGAWMGSEIGT